MYGRGLNSKTLFDEVKPCIDPLGQENVLCLAPGPLTGTPLGLTSRIEVSTLSPYSGILGDGNAGGSFSTLLKWAGYDQIVITGRASSPQYLWIDDENIELIHQIALREGFSNLVPETGIPTRGWLEHTGLKYVADELDAQCPYPEWEGPLLWSLNRYPHGETRA
jgi:hypothetical protein